MPFLGKDWRSCGEQWIRTEHGWERTRVLECILDNLNIGLNKEKMKKRQLKMVNKRLNSENDDDEFEYRESSEEKSSLSSTTMNNIEEEMANEDEDDWNYIYDELSLLSDEEDDEDDEAQTRMSLDEDSSYEGCASRKSSEQLQQHASLRRLGSMATFSSGYKIRQPHIIYWEVDTVNRENNAPKATISEVLNALDMPGAVKDIKRFNYVCRLVQIIINEKLNQLSGNAQRTLFMIVKHMLIQVIKTQENLNVMRKLLHDFKKKIQDSIYFYFYYIGSQKLCDKHLATIAKWQDILENPNHHKKLKRLNARKSSSASSSSNISNNTNHNNENKENKKNNYSDTMSITSTNTAQPYQPHFDNIPIDCKLEIMRRLNCGLDLINLSKCNRNLNDLISNELKIWKNLCQFHFQQTNINSFVNRLQSTTATSSSKSAVKVDEANLFANDNLDWKQIYFRLKRRYGHREVYVDMVHKCYHCKSLFWKEIGHPCVIQESFADPEMLEIRTEPITPKKLIELLLK